MQTVAADFDGAWKTALDYYFAPFLAFFFPVIHALPSRFTASWLQAWVLLMLPIMRQEMVLAVWLIVKGYAKTEVAV